MRVEASCTIRADAARVWAFAVRWEDQPRWIRDAVWVRVLSPAREGVGVRLHVLNRVLHVPLFRERLEVVVWEPPRRLQIAHRSFVRGLGTWRLDPDAGATRFTWTEELRVPVPQEPQLPALAPPVLLQVPPDLLLNLLSFPLPRVVVESEVPVHLQGRRSFSAAMARSSPPTGKPT